MSNRKPFYELSDRQKKRRLSKALENDLQQLISNNKSIISVNHSSDIGASKYFSRQSDISDTSSDVNAYFPNNLSIEKGGNDVKADSVLNNDLEETETRSFLFHLDGSTDLEDFDDFSSISSCSDDSNSSEDEVDNDYDVNVDKGSDFSVNNDNLEEEFNLRDFLTNWAITFQIRQNCLTSLLKGLQKDGHTDLPGDARTLLSTQKKIIACPLDTGQYSHYGLEKRLVNQLKWVDPKKIPDIIELHLNVDGLPLSKSSSSQTWPILVKIINCPGYHCNPFAVGIFAGYGKPGNPNSYLEPMISEYLDLNNDGFIFNDRKLKVSIRLFTADTVARNYILCFPPHYSRCGRCKQLGKTVLHRRVFLENDSPLRTDSDFREGVPGKYKNLLCPLEGIGMSITTQVPLDPMHLLDKGVGKKHLKLLLDFYGNAGADALRRINSINQLHISFKQWIPSDFVRKPRSFNELNRFKEYRTPYSNFVYRARCISKLRTK